MDLYSFEQRIKNPAQFKNDILAYIAANKSKVDINKTIAGVSLYHEKVVGLAALSDTFFNGAFVQANTNINSSFIRPEAEHVFITGVKIYQGNDTTTIENSSWGDLIEEKLQNGQFTITSNGVVMVKNFPMRSANPAQTGKYQNLIELDEIIFWEGQTELKLDVTFKSGGAVPVAIALRFELVGVGLVS